jgi:hypothetical protein
METTQEATMTRKPRSQAQRDAQLNAMEAARGAAARRAESRRREDERKAADQSRVELTAPRNLGAFMPTWDVRVVDADGHTRSRREFYSAAEAEVFADSEARFTARGVCDFNWDAYEFEARS